MFGKKKVEVLLILEKSEVCQNSYDGVVNYVGFDDCSQFFFLFFT